MTRDPLEKLSRHLVVGLAGPALTDGERSILSRYPVSGVILFDRNVAGVRSLMELTQDLRRVFRESRGAVPLIAADHEGGVVSVLARAIGVPPTQMAAGRTGDAGLCERLFAENARRLRSCGVNLLLGPVADVNSETLNPVIGSRSFGEDEGVVSNLTAVAVSAARRAGVLTCLKHFPGHGSSAVDSHLALGALASSMDELRRTDVRPFARGAAAGAECVMMGHVVPRGRRLPATIDPEIVGGMLRRELGFEGVVMTDALEMEGARAAAPSLADLCRASLEAGCDTLLFSKSAEEVFAALQSAAADSPAGFPGTDGNAPSPSSAARVSRLLDAAAAREKEWDLPNDPHVYAEIARGSIRVVGDGPPPVLPAGGWRAVFHAEKGEFERFPVRRFIERSLRSLGAPAGAGRAPSAGANGGDAASGAAAGPGGIFPLVPLEAPGGDPGLESREYVAAAPADSGADVVFLLNRRPVDAETARRLAAGARLVVVAGWPYAAELLSPEIRAIVTYGLYDSAADLVGGYAGVAAK